MDEVVVVVEDVEVVIEVVDEVVVVLTKTVNANVVVPYTVGG